MIFVIAVPALLSLIYLTFRVRKQERKIKEQAAVIELLSLKLSHILYAKKTKDEEAKG